MDLNDAIAELISVHVGPGMGIPFEPLDFANETTGRAFATVIATILNAVLSGQLIPLETCNARAAAMVDAAAGEAAGEVAAHGAAELAPFVRRRVRAITPASAQAALDAMISRAREVKPLVFTEGKHYGATGRTLVAHGILGKVEVTTGWENGKASASRSYSDTEWFGTEDEAIAFLQADCTARIHAALRANATDASEGER